jgi:hypothetical protein
MDDELIRGYHRWRSAEEDGRDEDADAAFATVFRGAVPEETVSANFTALTLAAVSAAAAHDAQRARRTRRLLMPVGVTAVAVGIYFGAGFVGSLLSGAVVGLLDLVVGGVVGAAGGVRTGTDLWSVLSSLGRALGAFISSPTVTVTILAIHGIAISALVALQRLLGTDGESFR